MDRARPRTASPRWRTRLGVEHVPTHGKGEHLVEYGSGRARYSGDLPRIRSCSRLRPGQGGSTAWRAADRRPLGDDGRQLDAQTLGVDAPQPHTQAGPMLEIVVEAVWAAEPADMSLLHVLFYVPSAGRLDSLIGARAAPSRTASSAARG